MIPRRTECVGTSRRALRESLAGWGATHLIDDAQVVLSELVTNAIRHADVPAGTQVLVCLDLDATRLRIEVSDGDDCSLPVKWERWTGSSEVGRGLRVVDELTSSRWGVEVRRTGIGKTVWAELLRARGEVTSAGDAPH